MVTSPPATSALAPLRAPVFRMLWLSWLMANICMWMNDVAAAWMMTSLTTRPIWVALVQAASTLPVFLLAVPSGALADTVDRKRYFLLTQVWVAVVALLLSAMVFLGTMNPALLLALTCANGVAMAMRWPVFSAIVPELVDRAQLPAALALNGVSMNISRIVGPLIAGAVIASAGSAWVFLLNAVLSLACAVVIGRWRREHTPHPLGRERLGAAMRVGWQHVMQSQHLKGVLLRICLFYFHATALIALLPLVARRMAGGDAGTFTLLLAAMGAGAIVATAGLPRLRQRCPRDGIVLGGTALQGAVMAVIAATDQAWIAAPAMLCCGAAWITTANTLTVSIQLGLPDWVRARGMSIYLMALMGASAVGAAVWGQVATWASVSVSLAVAAVTGVAAMALANRWYPDDRLDDDLTPRAVAHPPIHEALPEHGHVMVMIEYLVDPARTTEFRALMHNDCRRNRLRQGALSWELLADVNQPGHFVEVIVDESWTDQLRRFDRVTGADVALRERRQAFHVGESPPRITRFLMETTVKNH